MAELWDLFTYDQQKDAFIPTGATAERGSRLPKGTYHAVVHVWIRNPQGKYLISQRCEQKSHALCWEPTGGSMLAGETSPEAACREAREELGIALRPEQGTFVCRGVRHFDGCDDFVDVWLFDGVDVPKEKIKPRPEEVRAAMWAAPASIHVLRGIGAWMPWRQFDYLERIIGPEVPFASLTRDEAKAQIAKLHNTAFLLSEQGSFPQSYGVGCAAHQRAEEWLRRFGDPDTPEYWDVQASDNINWAHILEDADRLAEAEKYYDAYISAREKIYRMTNQREDRLMAALGYRAKGRFYRRHDLTELWEKAREMAGRLESMAMPQENK